MYCLIRTTKYLVLSNIPDTSRYFFPGLKYRITAFGSFLNTLPCICWNLFRELQRLFPFLIVRKIFSTYNRYLKLISMFQRPHILPTNLNALKAPWELKTMNSKPQIILHLLVGGQISQVNTRSGWSHSLEVNPSTQTAQLLLSHTPN